ncbi:hypothetical protein BKH31_09500 [Actinomyces oris]|uniref:Uncharacterized protein n=2 Tax=Actinomyces oris TaxID=544580 RepID=A0A1Q8VB65_9ACTO|nr:hypothetical protein [Actinomyces oris]OLO45328.1 hypothetical protein BKH31_09500 [Actinomyces oris]
MSPSPDSSAPESPSSETPSSATPPPAAPSQGAPAPASPPPAQRRRRARLGILSAVIALVLALGGGGIWALTRSSDPLSMIKAPILKAQQDLSNLGKELAAAPFDASGTVAITNKQLTILRVIADRRETLVALNPSSSSSYSAWQVPIPDNLAGQYLDCRMNAKTFDCGDQISIDLASGINAPAKPSTVSAAAPTAPASPVAPQPSDNRSAAPAQTGPSTIPNGMAPTNPVVASPTPSSGPGATASPSTATSGPAPTSVRLSEAPGGGTPLSVSSDGTVSVNGEKISGLKLDGTTPVWATRVEASRKLVGASLPMSREVWVVSNGVTVAGLDGSSVLWSSKLPDGAGSLNTLGTETVPRWQTSKGALVMAYPDSLRALDPVDGSTIWRVSTPVTSWAAGDGYVVVFNGSTTSIMTFDSGSSSTRATALPTSAPTSTAKPAPSLEELGGATLDIPAVCADGFASVVRGTTKSQVVEKMKDEKTSLTFSGGSATGAGANGPGGSNSTVAMKEAQPGFFGSSPVTVAVLECNSGTPAAFDVMAAYNGDKQMVGSLIMEGSNEIGYNPATRMDNLRVVGGTVMFDMPQFMVAGDMDCKACAGSGTAAVAAQWDGESLALFDVVYHLPNQDIHRPSLVKVQAVYDALAAKEDSKVTDQVDSAVLSSLDEPAGSTQAGDATARSAYLSKGGTVASCLLAGPKDSLFGTMVVTEELAPGSILCPITSEDQSKPWMQPVPTRTAQLEYGAWLTLTPSGDGFTVTGLGHRRS